VKEKKQEIPPTVEAKADPVVQIGKIEVVVQDMSEGPMVFGKSAAPPVLEPVMANDHEAGSSKTKVVDKYH